MRRIPTGPLLGACCTLALMLVAVSIGGGRDGAAPTDASELPAAPDTTLADADATAAAIAAALPEAAPASVLEETDASSPVTEDGEVPGGPPRWAVAALQRSLATHVQQHGGAIVAGVAVANGPRETLVAGSDPDDE